jgi:hypothetical protein
MVVSPFGRRLINRLHLLRRNPGEKSEMNLKLFRRSLRGAKPAPGMPPDIVHAYGSRYLLDRKP